MVFLGDSRKNGSKGAGFGRKHNARGFFDEEWLTGGREHSKGGDLGRKC